MIRYDVGTGYFETLGLQLIKGRFFDPLRPFEDAAAVVVNETFAKERQWADPLGRQFRVAEKTFTVIGVAEDFKIIGSGATRPVVFHSVGEDKFGYLVIRHAAGAKDRVESAMRSAWQTRYPEIPFSFFHQSLVFENFYNSFNNVATVFGYLAGMALIIACLGLFGMASQNYSSRLKEVSIRKIHGASVPDIVLLANRGFLMILLIASLVATAVCFSGSQVLFTLAKEFTGEMKLGIAPYLLANMLVFLTAGIAVAGQSYKLARISPAESLRNE